MRVRIRKEDNVYLAFIPNLFLPVRKRMTRMSNKVYIRCQNQNCRKLNPIQPNEEQKEHTCVFCGTIIQPQKTNKSEDASKSKSHDRRFPLQQSESKPINRNTRKPMF